MRFIHIADVHYGMKPDNGMPWAKTREQAIKDTFAKIIKECYKQTVDCLFICGDLFHTSPSLQALKEVNYLFSTIPFVQVVIIAGNHDYIHDNSHILRFPWAKNVHFLAYKNLASVYFPKINTEVFGFSYHSTEIRKPLLSGIRAGNPNRIQILMAHGGDEKHLPLDKKELANSGFAYIALGHIHKPDIVVENKMAYPGSPEPLDITENGAHGYILGDINPITKKVKLSFVPIASLQYIPFVIHVTPTVTNTELLQTVTTAIQKRGSRHIYRIKIEGLRDPDIEFDLDSLKDSFNITQILDTSEPDYDFGDLFADHSSDMLGFFINELHKDNMTVQEKKALLYGVDALLKTSDERI